MKRRRTGETDDDTYELPDDVLSVVLGRFCPLPLLVKFQAVSRRHKNLAWTSQTRWPWNPSLFPLADNILNILLIRSPYLLGNLTSLALDEGQNNVAVLSSLALNFPRLCDLSLKMAGTDRFSILNHMALSCLTSLTLLGRGEVIPKLKVLTSLTTLQHLEVDEHLLHKDDFPELPYLTSLISLSQSGSEGGDDIAPRLSKFTSLHQFKVIAGYNVTEHRLQKFTSLGPSLRSLKFDLSPMVSDDERLSSFAHFSNLTSLGVSYPFEEESVVKHLNYSAFENVASLKVGQPVLTNDDMLCLLRHFPKLIELGLDAPESRAPDELCRLTQLTSLRISIKHWGGASRILSCLTALKKLNIDLDYADISVAHSTEFLWTMSHLECLKVNDQHGTFMRAFGNQTQAPPLQSVTRLSYTCGASPPSVVQSIPGLFTHIEEFTFNGPLSLLSGGSALRSLQRLRKVLLYNWDGTVNTSDFVLLNEILPASTRVFGYSVFRWYEGPSNDIGQGWRIAFGGIPQLHSVYIEAPVEHIRHLKRFCGTRNISACLVGCHPREAYPSMRYGDIPEEFEHLNFLKLKHMV